MDWIEISMGLNISIPTVERVYEKKRKKKNIILRSRVYNSLWKKKKINIITTPFRYRGGTHAKEHVHRFATNSLNPSSTDIPWMEIYIGYCGMTADDCSTPSNQRGGGQASGDYRDKFDLKISYRRGWK